MIKDKRLRKFLLVSRMLKDDEKLELSDEMEALLDLAKENSWYDVSGVVDRVKRLEDRLKELEAKSE